MYIHSADPDLCFIAGATMNRVRGYESNLPVTLAPGVRVEIRGEEWIVQSADRIGVVGNRPAYSLLVTGVSELVRDQTTRFLSALEGESLKVVDPSETTLTTDDSPQFRKTRLYLQSLLLQSPLSGDGLGLGHLAAVDDLPYQRDPALQALQQPRQRSRAQSKRTRPHKMASGTNAGRS